MKTLAVVLATLQALLLIPDVILIVTSAHSSWPMRLYLVGALLFALPVVIVFILSRRVSETAEKDRVFRGALAAGMFLTFAGYLAYAHVPSPGRGYYKSGELSSGGPVFGVSIGMSGAAADNRLIASGRFEHVSNACLSPNTFEIVFPEGVPENPSERDCKGAGIEELWEAAPLIFGESQMLELYIRQGRVIHMHWQGGGTIIG